MSTDHPAAVRTSAAVAPPGPEPMIDGVVAVTGRRTSSSVQPRGWTSPGKLDRRPRHPVPVAAVLGRPVHPLAAVLVEQARRTRRARRPRRRSSWASAVDSQKSSPRAADAHPVPLLPADHRAVELPLGMPVGALDPGSPCQLVERPQPVERARTRGSPPWRARRRAAGPDAGRVEGEGAEQHVDVVDDAGLDARPACRRRGSGASLAAATTRYSCSVNHTGMRDPPGCADHGPRRPTAGRTVPAPAPAPAPGSWRHLASEACRLPGGQAADSRGTGGARGPGGARRRCAGGCPGAERPTRRRHGSPAGAAAGPGAPRGTRPDHVRRRPQCGREGCRRFSHLFVVVMENLGGRRRHGRAGIASLARRFASATAWYAVATRACPTIWPSPQASTFGVSSDCTDCLQDAPNLATQLDRRPGSPGAPTSRACPSPCFLGPQSADGAYAAKHDPFRYFTDVRSQPALCDALQPLGALEAPGLGSGADDVPALRVGDTEHVPQRPRLFGRRRRDLAHGLRGRRDGQRRLAPGRGAGRHLGRGRGRRRRR